MINMNTSSDYVLSELLRVKAIKIQPSNPFTWATGWFSPIYFDSRKLLSYPRSRNLIKLELARLIAEQYPQAEVIAAVATNAIAMGMLVAEALGLPFVYVHPEPKDHGFENRIEGDLRPRQNVVVIEDQVSVGKNCLKVVDAIRKSGCKVLGMFTLFNYNLPNTATNMNENEVSVVALADFDSVIKKALQNKIITPEEEKVLHSWQKNPAEWQK